MDGACLVKLWGGITTHSGGAKSGGAGGASWMTIRCLQRGNVQWTSSLTKHVEKLSDFHVSFWAPNHQRWHAKWKFGRNAYTFRTRLRTFDSDLHAQSVIINKISASELTKKFVKSALLVGRQSNHQTFDGNYWSLNKHTEQHHHHHTSKVNFFPIKCK